MAELVLFHHAQASFGSENYDVLSDLGRAQARGTGEVIRAMGFVPELMLAGGLLYQKQTLKLMGFGAPDKVHPVPKQYDFVDLLAQHFPDRILREVWQDRKTHYSPLCAVILARQGGAYPSVSETWANFAAWVTSVQEMIIRAGAKRVLATGSGGLIAQIVTKTLEALVAKTMALNLQIKNFAISRCRFNTKICYLHELNGLPQFLMRRIIT